MFVKARFTKKHIWITILLICFCFTPSLLRAQRYLVTDLGTLGGSYSGSYTINNVGQIAGDSLLNGGSYLHGFLWENGAMHDLGSLGSSFARGINNSGQVAGWADSPTANGTRAVLWTSGAMYELGALAGYPTNVGFGINSQGQITGWSYDSVGNLGPGFLWTPSPPNGTTGSMVNLPSTGGVRTRGYGVNDLSQVVGESADGNGIARATLWQNGFAALLDVRPSIALAINNAGQSVGFYTTGPIYNCVDGSCVNHAVLWKNGAPYDIGSLPGSIGGEANAINGFGQIIGDSGQHAFLWTPEIANGTSGRMKDLNDLIPPGTGWVLGEAGSRESANGINESGEIVGIGKLNGQKRAYLLTTNTAPDTSVPSTSASLAGPVGTSNWYRGPVTVTLAATDADGRGDVANTSFALNSGPTQTYSIPFAVSEDGIHTIYYWSQDVAGNTEATQSLGPVGIDATSPTVTAAASPASIRKTNKPVSVRLSGTIADVTSGVDVGSGVYSVIDSYGLVQPTSAFSINPNGTYSFTLLIDATLTRNKRRTYTITATAKDAAGNMGIASSSVAIN